MMAKYSWEMFKYAYFYFEGACIFIFTSECVIIVFALAESFFSGREKEKEESKREREIERERDQIRKAVAIDKTGAYLRSSNLQMQNTIEKGIKAFN